MKRNRMTWGGLALVLAALAVVAPQATADSAGRHPASLLIYPIFDSSPGAGTVLSVTNVSQDVSVVAHFIYIDGDDWREFNRFEPLTPRDVFSTSAKKHVPSARRGFLYVIALNELRQADSLNYLVGDEIVVDSYGNFLYALEAIPFCSKAPINDNFDEYADFNNEEYFKVADKMYVSSFLGQEKQGPYPLTSTLILVSLVGSSDYETRLDLLPYNNNEEEFSLDYRFRCWASVNLCDIDEYFNDWFLKANTGYDDRNTGLPQTSGWIELDGDRAVDVVGNEPAINDPPFVGAFVQALGYYAAGHLLHESIADNPTDGRLEN
ncbi:MAG: hypothetical protein RL885_27885 [Planctomycetota bacterium]